MFVVPVSAEVYFGGLAITFFLYFFVGPFLSSIGERRRSGKPQNGNGGAKKKNNKSWPNVNGNDAASNASLRSSHAAKSWIGAAARRSAKTV